MSPEPGHVTRCYSCYPYPLLSILRFGLAEELLPLLYLAY